MKRTLCGLNQKIKKEKKKEQEAGPASDAGQFGSFWNPRMGRGPPRPPEVVQAKYTPFVDRETNCTCLVSG